MSRESNVIEFYVLCNKLKDVIRTGWKLWGVERNRVESVAEHVYGTQMLALVMWQEYKYQIDIKKVLVMLAVHELEEIIIGDLTFFDVDKDAKNKMGHDAIKKILSKLEKGEKIDNLIIEFDERKTPEAKFAFFCDKLEADLQCKLYDEQNCVDIKTKLDKYADDVKVKEALEREKSWSGAWLYFSQDRYKYDENFLKVSNYAKNNKILKN